MVKKVVKVVEVELDSLDSEDEGAEQDRGVFVARHEDPRTSSKMVGNEAKFGILREEDAGAPACAPCVPQREISKDGHG